jgi:hypothetical protein
MLLVFMVERNFANKNFYAMFNKSIRGHPSDLLFTVLNIIKKAM